MRRSVRMTGLLGLTAAGLVAFPALALAADTGAAQLVSNPGFDVDAATRAWTSTLQGAARAKSDAYFEGGYWLLLWGALVSILVDLLILRLQLTVKLRDFAERRFGGRRAATVWFTALGYTLVSVLMASPWAIYTRFVRESQYGLMNQTLAEWLGDEGKSLAIDLLLLPLLILAIYGAIRRFPRRWWVLGGAILTVFVTIGALLAPVYIAPLFNKYQELPAGPVRDRIVAMAQARNVPATHVYYFDASKQSKRISANVSGVGPTMRISLNDNLYKRTSLPETAAVMGHEMGHYVLGHAYRGILFFGLLSFGILWAVARLAPAVLARYGAGWGIRDLADPASLPLLSIFVAVLGLLLTPVTNTFVRVDESEADAFGLDLAHEPDGFASVAMKLSEYRKIEPGPIEEFLFFDHPSGATRVRMAMQWKKDHVPGATMVTPPPMVQDAAIPK